MQTTCRAAIVASVWASLAWASEGPPPILNPYRAASANGEWVLHVNPTDLLGRGPADYRMEHEGRVAWSNSLPFTLWEAAIAQDGRVAGYAYTHGWRGFSTDGHKAGMGQFIVALLAPSGAVLRQHTVPREASRWLHTPPDPLATGLRIDEKRRHFTVRTADPDIRRRREKLTSYGLRNGRKLDAVWRSRQPLPERKPPAEPWIEWSNLTVEALAVTPLAVATGMPSSLRALESFDFDGDGNIAALRWERPASPVLVMMDEVGSILREVSLPFPTFTNHPAVAGPEYVGGGRFVVTLSERAISGRVEVAWADVATGAATSRPVNVPSIKALAGFPDGRFAALTVAWRPYSMVDDLHLFDADGRPLWSLENSAGYGGQPEELLSPEDIARDGTNIVVLDKIRHTLQSFSPLGRLARSIDLDDVWPIKPRYPTDISSDRQGGFIVHDFGASNTFVRIDADGRLQARSLPRHPDGTPFRVYDGIKRSPQGDLWTCDGHTLLRLDESGVVTRVLGPALDALRLDTPGYTFVDARGRAYVADERTRAVHIFEPKGALAGVCAPGQQDLSDLSRVGAISVTCGGDIFIALGYGKDRVRFDREGRRIGPVKIDVDRFGQSWHFAPTGDLCWVSTSHDVFLVQGLTQIVCAIRRRADGRWLEYPDTVAHAPDGSAAILSRSQSNELFAVICDPGGTPRVDVPLPSAWRWGARLLFDGDRLFVRWEHGLFRFARNGTPEGWWSLPEGARWDGPFLDGQTGDLLFVDRDGWFVRSFRCP